MPAAVLLDGFHHHRTAQAWAECDNFIERQPHSALDAVVEPALGVVLQWNAKKSVATICDAIARCGVERNAEKALDVHCPPTFLESFTSSGLDKSFVALEMACRLIEDQFAVGVFFYQQKTIVLFDHSGDSNVRVPAHKNSAVRRGTKEPRIIRGAVVVSQAAALLADRHCGIRGSVAGAPSARR